LDYPPGKSSTARFFYGQVLVSGLQNERQEAMETEAGAQRPLAGQIRGVLLFGIWGSENRFFLLPLFPALWIH